jgi:hypothetical protein
MRRESKCEDEIGPGEKDGVKIDLRQPWTNSSDNVINYNFYIYLLVSRSLSRNFT